MKKIKEPRIYIVSGGSGASGNQVVQTVLAQFRKTVDLVTVPNARVERQIDAVFDAAARDGSIVVITLVNESINSYALKKANQTGVVCIDLMRDLLEVLSETLENQPVGHPGLYRRLHKDYFDRVGAIEYTMAHDDGKDPGGWKDAEMLLTGVSRVGKTPLCLYLSVLGWKAANVPLIPDIPVNPQLFEVDVRKIIGLTMQPRQLLKHRRHRQRRLGVNVHSTYADPDAVRREVGFFDEFMRTHGITVIDATNKPIETSADEVIKIIERRFP